MESSPDTHASHSLRSIVGALLALALDVLLLAWGLGGLQPLLHEPRALALLAVWGIAGFTLALMRPIRTQDVTLKEPDVPLMLVLFVVPLVAPAVSAWGGRMGWWPLAGGVALSWSAIALVALGLAIRIGAMAKLGSRFSPLVAVQRDHQLETGGLYGIVRHPGYLGAWLATLGASLAFGSAVALPLAALMAIALFVRLRHEDRVLRKHFGETWRRYAARTGGLFPRPSRPRE